MDSIPGEAPVLATGVPALANGFVPLRFDIKPTTDLADPLEQVHQQFGRRFAGHSSNQIHLKGVAEIN